MIAFVALLLGVHFDESSVRHNSMRKHHDPRQELFMVIGELAFTAGTDVFFASVFLPKARLSIK